MTVRNLISRCRNAREELDAITHQQERLAGIAIADNVECLRKRLVEQEAAIFDDLSLFDELIIKIKNQRARTVMRYYYGCGLSDLDISLKMDISEEWVRKMRYAAIRVLECVESKG